MNHIISEIVTSELGETIESVFEITDLGSVNKVYDVTCKYANYIIRINQDQNKEFEFWKEKWCMEKASSLNIPSPKVLKVGIAQSLPFMIMIKIDGENGSKCSPDRKLSIWNKLGSYANAFHDVAQIDKLRVPTDEFHPNWSSKLEYNISQLSSYDSLLRNNTFNKEEHVQCREMLKGLRRKSFNIGLIHGDLSPRNVIFSDEAIVLLDWGCSKIDIAPHTEIGIDQSDNKLSPDEFDSFLHGLKLSRHEFDKIRDEIDCIHFLNSLDVYRWAEGSNFIEIENYKHKLRIAFENMVN